MLFWWDSIRIRGSMTLSSRSKMCRFPCITILRGYHKLFDGVFSVLKNNFHA
jgi:hypothetical protein